MKKWTTLVAALLMLSACNQKSGTKSAEEQKQTKSEGQKAAGEKEPTTKPSLSMEWETDTTLITNESVLYHESGDVLYVSNIMGKPTNEDGKGYISKVTTSGQIMEHKWASGLDAPKGMGIHKGKLYVTNINELVAVDLEDPSKMKRYPVEGAKFLNDVTIAGNKVYFSDMKTGKLHLFEDGEVTTFRENHPGLNGLAYHNGNLYALDGNGLHHIPEDGSEPHTINADVTNGDGLVVLNDSTFIASRWKGEIWHVQGSEATKMLDTKEKVQTADIGYNRRSKTLYVPRFFANKVTAMQFKPGG